MKYQRDICLVKGTTPYELLICGIIKQAKVDYRRYAGVLDKMKALLRKSLRDKGARSEARRNRLRERIEEFESAEKYLFDPELLESQIEKFGLPLNINFIREEVKNPNIYADEAVA